VAALLGVPVPTLEAWRRLRIGPPAIRVGRAVVWRQLSVAAWVADGGALEYGIDLPPSGTEWETISGSPVASVAKVRGATA
jgi:hypothetical protein